MNHGYTYFDPATAPTFTFYEPRQPPTIAQLEPAYGSLAGGAANAVTVRGANFAPTGRALACRFGEQVVTAEFVNVSVVRCVPPAIARPTTVPFSVAHDYEHGSPLPALRIDPDTGRAVGGVTSGASRGRALGWHPHTWGWHAADETGGEAADDTADVALGLGGDNQRSKLPALWAEPTTFTFYGEG